MSSAPTPYVKTSSFTALAAVPYTETGLPGGALDAEFTNIAASMLATQARLALLQRDDGAVRNGSVGFLGMSADVLAAFTTIGSNYRGAWSPGQNYKTGDLVISSADNYPYLCGIPHTSASSFDADFSSGVWAILGYRPTTDMLVVNTFSGTGSATVFTLTKNPVSSSNTQVYVAGVYQKKSTYTVVGTTLTFTSAPASGTNNIEVVIGVSAALINNVVTIPVNSVGTEALIDLKVTTGKLADLAVTSAKLEDGATTTAKLNALAVTTEKLAASAVTADKIAGGTIDSTKMAAGSVQTAAIQPGAVVTDKLGDLAVTSGKLAAGSVTADKLAAGVILTPAGAVMAFAMNAAPIGWLAADGSKVSRTAYAELFTAIGITYGAGDGTTTFTIPDLRGYFVRGAGTNGDLTNSGAFGAKQADEFKAHGHPTFEPYAFVDYSYGEDTYRPNPTGGVLSGLVGGTETRPKNIAMLYCIKY